MTTPGKSGAAILFLYKVTVKAGKKASGAKQQFLSAPSAVHMLRISR